MGALRLAFVVVVLGAFTFILMPLQSLAIRRKWRLARRLPYYWQRLARRLIGLRVRVVGTPAAPPLLITANHVSWLDITTIGSVLPVSFIAKSEVAGWPVLGTLARLQNTIFIDRTKRQQAAEMAAAIARRIDHGDVMVLFAEGTTGDGNTILPFRSALLGAASAAGGQTTTTVQPLAVTYTRLGGLPVGRGDRPGIAWYGDTDFVPHFKALMRGGAIDAVVAFGEPLTLGPDQDRKKVADLCFSRVRNMAADARQGRLSRHRHSHAIFSDPRKGAKETVEPDGADVDGAARSVS